MYKFILWSISGTLSLISVYYVFKLINNFSSFGLFVTILSIIATVMSIDIARLID